MPKLSKEKAAAVNEAEGQGDFEALPEGRYIAELTGVDGDGKGPKGPYWTWQFDVVDVPGTAGEGHGGRKLWLTTSLGQDWAVKRAFEAFGVPADTDTDELITQVAVLMVSQREIEKGQRKGQLGNNVDNILPLTEEDEVPASED